MEQPEREADPFESPLYELASRQASLAFERTLLSLDLSLMGAIRTSLSLIGFGFAMVLFFQQFGETVGTSVRIPVRNFGLFLVALGIAMVTFGLAGHRRRFVQLRRTMDTLHARKLLIEGCPYRHAPIGALALLLLLAGLLVLVGIVVRIGPFG